MRDSSDAWNLPGISESADIRRDLPGRDALGKYRHGDLAMSNDDTPTTVVSTEPPSDSLVSLPVLPLKNAVLFPYLFLPLSANRPSSVAAVEAALATEDKTILVVTQRNTEVEQPTADDLYIIGTKAVVKKMARGDAGIELLVQGLERVSLVRLEQTEPYLRGRVRPLPLPDDTGTEVEALRRAVVDLATRALELVQAENADNFHQLAAQAQDPLILVFLIGSMMSLDIAQEQALLEVTSRLEALRLLHGYLAREVQVLELRQKISSRPRAR